jgi:hypothetical protein
VRVVESPSKSNRRRSPRLARLVQALVAGFVATIGSGLVASACSAKASAVGPGGECFLATDCAPGLVCIEQPNKTRVCSDDLSRVAGRTPPDGAVENQDGSTDGPQADVNVGPRDSGGDTGNSQPDTGTPQPDAGDAS